MLTRVFMLLVLAAPALAQPSGHDAREKREVIAIFDLLTSTIAVDKGQSASTSDFACVFAEQWDTSWGKNETKRFRPRELISIRTALDPHNKHAEMFCDREKRNQEALASAALRGEQVSVVDAGFSYPVFDHEFRSAKVYLQRWTLRFAPPDKKPRGSSAGFDTIVLKKVRGAWTYEIPKSGEIP